MRSSLVRQILLLVGLAFLPAIGQAVYFRNNISWQQPPTDPGQVTLAQAEAWGDNVLWVDARPSDDFDAGHVPGAVQLNEDRWDQLLAQMLMQWSPERKVVVYCSAQSCQTSHEVAERLRQQAGLKNIHVLQGGWEGWQTKHR